MDTKRKSTLETEASAYFKLKEQEKKYGMIQDLPAACSNCSGSCQGAFARKGNKYTRLEAQAGRDFLSSVLGLKLSLKAMGNH